MSRSLALALPSSYSLSSMVAASGWQSSGLSLRQASGRSGGAAGRTGGRFEEGRRGDTTRQLRLCAFVPLRSSGGAPGERPCTTAPQAATGAEAATRCRLPQPACASKAKTGTARGRSSASCLPFHRQSPYSALQQPGARAEAARGLICRGLRKQRAAERQRRRG